MARSPGGRRQGSSDGLKAASEPLNAARTAACRGGISWRGRVRLVATLSNTAMVLYIYVAHLLELEWEHFGRWRVLGDGESQRLWDYVRAFDLEVAFEHLRLLTFSDAMLQNLHVYLIVGTPVAIVLFVLERDRVRWLQALAEARLPVEEAGRASWWLRVYLQAVSLMLILTLAIAPFHLGLPRAHYLAAGSALCLGMVSVCAYLTALRILDALMAQDGEQDGELVAWTWRTRHCVRPALMLVVVIHALAFIAAVVKAESLGDDRSALAFGILETLVVLGYQLYQGVFVVDDMMVGREALEAPSVPKLKEFDRIVKEKVVDEPVVDSSLMGS